MTRRLKITVDIESDMGHRRRGFNTLAGARWWAAREMKAPNAMMRIEGDASIADFILPVSDEDRARNEQDERDAMDEGAERQGEEHPGVRGPTLAEDVSWADGFALPWWANRRT